MNKRCSFPLGLHGTAVTGTCPGLRPSLGSEQPAPPWAGLLLDRTRPLPWRICPAMREMSRIALSVGGGQVATYSGDPFVRIDVKHFSLR
jgi:hypothetical protein